MTMYHFQHVVGQSIPSDVELAVVRDVGLDEVAHLGGGERLAEHLLPAPAVAGADPGQVQLPPPPHLHHDPVRAHRPGRLLPERGVQPHAPPPRLLLLGQQRRLPRPRPGHRRRRERQERGLPDGHRRGAGALGVAEPEVERRAREPERQPRRPHHHGPPVGGVAGVGGEERLALPRRRHGWDGLAVGGAEVRRAEGGVPAIAGGRIRRLVVAAAAVAGEATGGGERRRRGAAVLGVVAVGEGRRRGREEVGAACAGGGWPLRRRRRRRHGGKWSVGHWREWRRRRHEEGSKITKRFFSFPLSL